jgi:integrase
MGYTKVRRHSIKDLNNAFERSLSFRKLSWSTKRYYLRSSEIINSKYGSVPANDVTPVMIQCLMDELSDRPGVANQTLSYTKRLFNWGIARGYSDHNPATGVKSMEIGEYEPWSEADIASFSDYLINHRGDISHRCNRAVKLAFFFGLYTGQRKGDILNMKWGDIVSSGNMGPSGWLRVKQGKTGQVLLIPVSKMLERVIQQSGRGLSEDFIVCIDGNNKMKDYQFDYLWKVVLDEAEMMGVIESAKKPTFHGLRKNAAIRMAQSGCTEREIMSITGHKTTRMVSRYVKQANQKTMAQNAMSKLEAMEV